MADTFEKEDANTLKVTSDPPPEERSYDFLYLEGQRAQILKDQLRVAQELADVDDLIAQATALGIVAKPAEVATAEVAEVTPKCNSR